MKVRDKKGSRVHFTLEVLQFCQCDLSHRLSLIYFEQLDFIELAGKFLKATFIQQQVVVGYSRCRFLLGEGFEWK